MRFVAVFAFCLCCVPSLVRAADVNLATLTCVRYQNEVLAAPTGTSGPDPINTVMWLFGYSVAKSGAHVMYGEALAGFGFALDAECKSNPSESLLDAISTVKPDSKNPMDLNTVDCSSFVTRHVELAKNDAESADTIMMWLFGFAVAKSGSHIFDAASLSTFGPAFLADCEQHGSRSLYDELSAIKYPKARP